MDMVLHFLPRHNSWLKDRCTWRMQQGRQEVRSQMYYILGIDSRLFQYISVRDMRHQLDHYISMGYLRGELKEDLMGYLRKVHCLPLCPLHHNLASDPDKLFSELNIPPTAQFVVEGQVHLEDATGRTRGPVPDVLHSWNR